MIVLHCRECGVEYERYPSRAGPFCSSACSGRNQAVPIADRLPTLLGQADECRPFLGGTSDRGYGKIYGMLRSGESTRHWRAHCAAYALAYGLTTDEMQGVNVLHTCDNPPCCEPAHLWIGTHQDNQADKVAKGRQARGDSQWTRKPKFAALMSDVSRRRRAHALTPPQCS